VTASPTSTATRGVSRSPSHSPSASHDRRTGESGHVDLRRNQRSNHSTRASTVCLRVNLAAIALEGQPEDSRWQARNERRHRI
jgi:hypothetical protein